MAADKNEGFEFADLVNLDIGRAALLGLFDGAFFGLVIAIRRDTPEVRMIAGVEPAAGLALTAGTQIGRGRFTKQKCGQLFRESRLADPGRANQEYGVRKPAEPLPEELFSDGTVPVYLR
jgi:hypothetical protein